jgi:co-chaperonin GroES (HSP10)
MAKTKPNKFDISQHVFRGDQVLIKALRPEKVGELYKPEQYDDKPEFGEIVALGSSGCEDLKVGDVVFFGKYSTEQTRSLGADYFLIRQEDIKSFAPRT